jgi:hypothetical protein
MAGHSSFSPKSLWVVDSCASWIDGPHHGDANRSLRGKFQDSRLNGGLAQRCTLMETNAWRPVSSE